MPMMVPDRGLTAPPPTCSSSDVPFMDRKIILILTHTVLGLPPALLLVLAATQGLDQRLEDAAASPVPRHGSVFAP